MRRQPITPPVIVGGGPAGCAAAITLARAGVHPVLIERSAGPVDKVCGDFLGADTIRFARALGCDPESLGAVPIRLVRLVHGRREAEAALPFQALSLSRRALDEALLARAENAGADIRRGEAIRRIAPVPNGWRVDERETETVFLATGKHDMRGYPRPRTRSAAVGLKQYLRLTDRGADRLGSATELTLFRGGYAGLQPVEGGLAALCIAVRATTFQAIGCWDALLLAIGRESLRFADLLAGATPQLPKPLAVAGVCYGHLHRDAADGLFRLGDQAAVIPSLTGDGMAIAMRSGSLAAETWLRGGGASEFHALLRHDLARQMRLAGMLHAAFLQPALQPVVLSAALPSLIRLAAALTRVAES